MNSNDNCRTIAHEGIVQKNSGKSVTVSILANSACSGCHTGGSCMLSTKETKLIQVSGNYNIAPGDTVTILMSPSAGFAALLYGYILPVIVVVSLLIILNSLGFKELSAGLISLCAMLPYYLIIFLFRERINRKFTFTLKF